MREFWREVFTPSEAAESAYLFFLIAVAHVAAGAAMGGAVGRLGFLAVVAYGAWQIARDGRVGRSPFDSVADTLLVALGVVAALAWDPLWPLAWLVICYLATWAREVFRGL